MRHVADGIDVDEKPDAGHDQHHHRRERVDAERDVGAEGTGDDPRIDVVDEPRARGRAQQRHDRGERDGERDADHTRRDDRDEALPVAENDREEQPGERQRRNQPERRRRDDLAAVHRLTSARRRARRRSPSDGCGTRR